MSHSRHGRRQGCTSPAVDIRVNQATNGVFIGRWGAQERQLIGGAVLPAAAAAAADRTCRAEVVQTDGR